MADAEKQSLSLLASEMFGHDFHGEVEKPAAASEGEGDPPDEGAEGDAQDPPPEGGDVEGEPDEGEGDAPAISSLQELIEANEWEPEFVNALRVAVKVDGKPGEATLKDLVDGYQMRQAAEHRLEEAKVKSKAVNDELAAKVGKIDQEFAVATKIIERAESLLNDDAGAVNWKQLRDSDPAEYAAKRAEVAERRAEIDGMKRDAAIAWQQGIDARKQEFTELQKQRFVAEQAALLEAPLFSEWRDSDKAKAGKAKLAEYLPTQGFSRDEIMGASDHRLLVLAEKARRYDEMTSKTDAARKKMATVPKVLKPGAPKPAQQQAKEQADKLKSRLRATGSLDDAAALLKARRTGG